MDPIQVIVLHGLLMWLGMGLCMPVGVILIRFLRATRQEGNTIASDRIARAHIVVQSTGLLLALLGGALTLSKFGTAGLAHTHGRLGLALLLAPILAAFLGVVRPKLGAGWKRGLWYAAHWTLGTSTVVLASVNIFIGMHVYELISARSLLPFNVAFSVQLAVLALLYLAQDRWAYLRQVQWALPATTPANYTKSVKAEVAIAIPECLAAQMSKTSTSRGLMESCPDLQGTGISPMRTNILRDDILQTEVQKQKKTGKQADVNGDRGKVAVREESAPLDGDLDLTARAEDSECPRQPHL